MMTVALFFAEAKKNRRFRKNSQPRPGKTRACGEKGRGIRPFGKEKGSSAPASAFGLGFAPSAFAPTLRILLRAFGSSRLSPPLRFCAACMTFLRPSPARFLSFGSWPSRVRQGEVSARFRRFPTENTLSPPASSFRGASPHSLSRHAPPLPCLRLLPSFSGLRFRSFPPFFSTKTALPALSFPPAARPPVLPAFPQKNAVFLRKSVRPLFCNSRPVALLRSCAPGTLRALFFVRNQCGTGRDLPRRTGKSLRFTPRPVQKACKKAFPY